MHCAVCMTQTVSRNVFTLNVVSEYILAQTNEHKYNFFCFKYSFLIGVSAELTSETTVVLILILFSLFIQLFRRFTFIIIIAGRLCMMCMCVLRSDFVDALKTKQHNFFCHDYYIFGSGLWLFIQLFISFFASFSCQRWCPRVERNKNDTTQIGTKQKQTVEKRLYFFIWKIQNGWYKNGFIQLWNWIIFWAISSHFQIIRERVFWGSGSILPPNSETWSF